MFSPAGSAPARYEPPGEHNGKPSTALPAGHPCAITGPIFQTFWLNYYDGNTERTTAARISLSPFYKRREKSLISFRFVSTLNQR
jgi:hypothetical protein